MRTFNKALWAISNFLAWVLALSARWLGPPAQAVTRARVCRTGFMQLLRWGIHPFPAALAVMGIPFLATFADLPGTLVMVLTAAATTVSVLLLPLAFSSPGLQGPVVATRRGRHVVALHLNQSADNPFACKSAVREAVRELAKGGARRIVMDSPLLVDETRSRRLATQLQRAVASTGLSARCTLEDPSYWSTVRSAFFAPYLRFRPESKFAWKENQVRSRRVIVDIAVD